MRVEYEVPTFLPPEVRKELVQRFGIWGRGSIILNLGSGRPCTVAYELDRNRVPQLLDLIPHLRLLSLQGGDPQELPLALARAVGDPVSERPDLRVIP